MKDKIPSSFQRIYGAFYERRHGPDWENYHVCGVNGYLCGYCSGRITTKTKQHLDELAEAQRHQDAMNEQDETAELE